MKIKSIKTESDYRQALKRVSNLMEAKPGTPEGDELDILTTLIEKYEEEKWPISGSNPIFPNSN